MTRKLRCLIIDDEPLARKGLAEYVAEIDFLELAGECGSAVQASGVLAQGGVDLLLLDIQMPRMTGIEFLKTLKNPPLVIFTTAYSEYALDGYALDIIDYLIKPIPFDRFLRAVRKAYDFQLLKDNRSVSDFFFVKSNSKYERIFYNDILYVEAMQNYVIIHVSGNKFIAYMTLAGIEEQLPHDQFIKVHKSFLVSVAQVNSIENNEIIIRQSRIPISRNLREQVMNRILGNNLLHR